MDKDAPTIAVWSHSSKSIDLPYANGGQKDILLRSANIKKDYAITLLCVMPDYYRMSLA